MDVNPASIRAWRPDVHGIVEVFHAHFADYAYPVHTHDAWTLMIVDDGVIRYDLDRHSHGALRSWVTLLPPQVAHDGRTVTADGFRKRVLYLDTTVLDGRFAGRAVDEPTLRDRLLRRRVHQLHQALGLTGEDLETESRLAFVAERIREHLGGSDQRLGPPPTALAHRLRDLLDARPTTGITLHDAGAELQAHPTHLVREFTRRFGLPPHAYLVGRRIEIARRLLLAGQGPADAAMAAGFADQSHLTRHFKRHIGTTPSRFAKSGPRCVAKSPPGT